MLANVLQHVDQRIPDFAGRAKNPQVVAVAQHRTAARERRVHDAREARAERLHTASEPLGVVCLDEEVRVVRLERVVHDAETAAIAKRDEGSLEGAQNAAWPQRGQPGSDLQRDERRMSGNDSGTD